MESELIETRLRDDDSCALYALPWSARAGEFWKVYRCSSTGDRSLIIDFLAPYNNYVVLFYSGYAGSHLILRPGEVLEADVYSDGKLIRKHRYGV